MWAGLLLILLLTGFSIYGAFIGAEAAQQFFNSVPLAVYWLALAVLLISAIALFHRLLHIRGLFLIHLGCVLVLAGAIWGSQAGGKIQKALFEIEKIRTGQMAIYEGQSESAVVLADGQIKELPFSIRLRDFRIEYYAQGRLEVRTRDGIGWKIPARPGSEYFLSADYGSITIIRKFDSFKISIDGDNKTAVDDPSGAPNPAIEVEIKNPNGTRATKYVFERFPQLVYRDDKLLLSYQATIRDYISDVDIVKNGQVAAQKKIEVNHPLHFGGYFFTQNSYDEQAGKYTVLGVVSDTGLSAVYVGYAALCIGLFWHLWVRAVAGKRKQNGD